MKTASRLLALSVLASGAFFTTSSFACTTGAWTTAAAGSTAGDPKTSIARVAGKCGLKVTGTGKVVDNTPAEETTFIARFYFYGKNMGAGTHEIFSASSEDDGAGTKQIKITYDGTNVKADATGGGGTASANVAAIANKWNLVEVKWDKGAPGSLWVNKDATSDAASATFTSSGNAATSKIGSAQLGAITSVGANSAFFDDYVSHRSLAVGPALLGDSNNDGNVNGLDVSGVLKEAAAFGSVLQIGTPDCNLDAAVNGLDISGILKAAAAFNPVPCG